MFREQNEVPDELAKIVVRRKCDWIEFYGPSKRFED